LNQTNYRTSPFDESKLPPKAACKASTCALGPTIIVVPVSAIA